MHCFPINRIQSKYMLEHKSSQIVRESMSSYVGYRNEERIVLYVIVKRDSNEKQAIESSRQHRDRRHRASIEPHLKRSDNAGSWTSVRTLTQMGCSLHANWFSDVKPCVFEPIVIFAIRKIYFAIYVQNLQ